MLKKYKDFSIYYDSKSKIELAKLLVLLKENYNFYKSILPNKISLKTKYINHYKIDDIEKYILSKIRQMMQEDWVKNIKKDKSRLSSMYEDYLFYIHEKDSNDNYVNKEEDYNLSLVSFIYYDNDRDIYHSLANIKTEKEKFLSYIKKYGREKVLNDLLSQSIEQIQNNFGDLIPTIQPIWNEIIEEKKMNIKETNNELSPLSEEELIILAKLFLKQIDEEQDYVNIFDLLLERKDLIMLESTDNLFNWSNARNKKITIYRKHNTEDFKVLIHEFIHYVENHDMDKDPDNILLIEFPSIYYEQKAIDFLESIGISEEERESLKNIRRNYIKNATYAIEDLIDLVKLRMEKYVTNEDAINIIKKNHPNLDENSSSLQLDYYIKSLIETKTGVFLMMTYVTAYNLSKKYLEQDPKIMKEITLNLFSLNPKDVIEFHSNNKQYKKVIN